MPRRDDRYRHATASGPAALSRPDADRRGGRRTRAIRSCLASLGIAVLLGTAPPAVSKRLALEPTLDTRPPDAAVRVREGFPHDLQLARVETVGGAPAPAAVTRDAHADDARHHLQEAYVVDIDTTLVGDADHDGYHRGFAITVDIDTTVGWLDVFVRLYLQPDHSRLDSLHTGRPFRVSGADHRDRWRIEIELLDRWRTDHYDIVVEVVDAHTGHVLDTVGPHEFRNLGHLPLETDEHFPADDFVAVSYTGSAALLPLLLAFGWFLRIGGPDLRRYLYSPRRSEPAPRNRVSRRD